uniref:Uncharacterized protein n=2 Tax=Oncorhynchus kisutch TaxID=8019 RepID=A0A8C7N7D9_ONCKI
MFAHKQTAIVSATSSFLLCLQAGLFTMAANMTVHQQVAAPSMKGWKTGLFDSFQDMSICCNEFWCCPCYASSTTGEFGESTYLPLMDIIGPAFMAAIGVPVIVPPASLSMRVAVRHKYGIQGSLFEDILVSCFCACCSWCQMAREIKEHKKGCTFTTTQPVSIQVQPPTMTTSNVSYTTNQQSYTMTSPTVPQPTGLHHNRPTVPTPTGLRHNRPTVPQPTELRNDRPSVPQSTGLHHDRPTVPTPTGLCHDLPTVLQRG